ncbi:MAG: hypothetical protein K2K93_07090 [Muribaculaceae bacterium]|nr:hypothetical protein [Muribaculaceae bacterium]
MRNIGSIKVRGGSVTFHYYTLDYLGNNRAVINSSTGAIEQTVAYYPYGSVIADLGTNLSKQQYKFGGKELLTGNWQLMTQAVLALQGSIIHEDDGPFKLFCFKTL